MCIVKHMLIYLFGGYNNKGRERGKEGGRQRERGRDTPNGNGWGCSKPKPGAQSSIWDSLMEGRPMSDPSSTAFSGASSGNCSKEQLGLSEY